MNNLYSVLYYDESDGSNSLVNVVAETEPEAEKEAIAWMKKEWGLDAIDETDFKIEGGMAS